MAIPRSNAGPVFGSEAGDNPVSPGYKSTTDSFAVSVSAGWEIDLWGRIRRLTEAARAELLASEEGRRGVVLTLVGDVAAGQQFPISRYSLFLGGMRESAFVNFLEQSHDAAGGWPRYGEPPAVG